MTDRIDALRALEKAVEAGDFIRALIAQEAGDDNAL